MDYLASTSIHPWKPAQGGIILGLRRKYQQLLGASGAYLPGYHVTRNNQTIVTSFLNINQVFINCMTWCKNDHAPLNPQHTIESPRLRFRFGLSWKKGKQLLNPSGANWQEWQIRTRNKSPVRSFLNRYKVFRSCGTQWMTLLPPQHILEILQGGGVRFGLNPNCQQLLLGASVVYWHGWHVTKSKKVIAKSFPNLYKVFFSPDT